MTYLGEFRSNWRYLTAASIGLGAGYTINNYLNNIFTPHLLKEFDWSRSDVAFVGVAIFLAVICQPIAGRLADAFGVRRMAIVGVIASPLILIGFSLMTGNLLQFYLLTTLQIVIVGGGTGVGIYTRLVAHEFERARGMALAIATAAPSIAGAVCAPFLSSFIDEHGWRAGYTAAAAWIGISGVVAVLMIPREESSRRSVRLQDIPPSSRSYGAIMRNPAFLMIIFGILLCNLSFTMQTSHLKVILLDKGIDSATGSLAISLFAIGAIVGRLLCGLALDRFPTYAVAAISFGCPGLGLGVLASDLSAPVMMAAAVLVLGLCMGAEGDILAYLVTKYFRLEIFSTVFGIVLGTFAFSMAFGSLLLSLMLKLNGGYGPFLVLSATSAFVGSGVFLLLRRIPVASNSKTDVAA